MDERKRYLPSKAKIAEYWVGKRFPNGESIIVDKYEPSCWGCGHSIYNSKEEELIKDRRFNELWNSSIYGLERCHIIPKALGGSDKADNLFLMCKYCHKSSPDTTNPQYFFEWVMERTSDDMVKETPQYKASQDMLNSGASVDDVNNFFEKLLSQEIPLDLEINTHGFEFSDSTLKYSYIDAFNKFIKNEARGSSNW